MIMHTKFRVRLVARFLAYLLGYYWLPCPICKNYHAGFETHPIPLMDNWSTGRAVCLDCGFEANKRNQHLYKTTRWL